jgi:cell wall-associated NlpC family hydrolase
VFFGILAALLIAVPAFATPSPIDAKKAEAQQVLGEISQLDASLGRANERLNLANIQLAQVQGQIKVNRRELGIAKLNLHRSQKAIAKRLVTLYTKGESSALEVILGARTLTDVLNRIETEDKVSSLDTQVIEQVVTYRTSVTRHAHRLRIQRAHVKRLIAQRAAEQRSLQYQIIQRKQLFNSLSAQIQQMIAAEQLRQLRAAQAARAAYLAAQAQAQQARQSQAVGAGTYGSTATQAGGTSTFGAAAATPEGATVVPSSSYSGAAGVALSEIGVPYQWAGSSPGGFDCSGLVMYAYSKEGVSLPHSSYAQWNVGTAVPKDQLQAGDLVFFDGLGHVGIYIGNGEFVHAPHTGDVVKVSNLDSGSYAGSYVGARRVT